MLRELHISRIAAQFFALAARRRMLLFALLIAAWGASIFAVSHVHISNSSTAFFPDSSKELQMLARGMDLAPFSRHIFIDIYTENSSTSETAAQELCDMASAIEARVPQEWATPFSQNAMASISPEALLALIPSLFDERMEKAATTHVSPAAVDAAVQSTHALLTGFPVKDAIPWLRGDPLRLRELLLPFMPQQKLFMRGDARFAYPVHSDAEHGTHALLILRPTQSMHDTAYAVTMMNALESAITQSTEHTPHISASVIAGLRHTAANTRAIDNDVQSIAIISLVGLALVYALFVRSWGAIWLLLTPCFAFSIAMGMMNLFFSTLSGLALGFGAAVLGITEDYAVHMHFALRSQKTEQRVFALLSTPLFQGLLLNASGFTVLLFSSVPAVRQLVAFALCALITGFLLALFVLPLCPFFAVPQIANKKKREQQTCLVKRLPTLARTAPTVLLLSLATAALLYTLPVDVSPQSMGAGMEHFQRDASRFAAVWQQKEQQILLVEGATQSAMLHTAAQTVTHLRKAMPEAHFTSMSDILLPQGKAQENCQRWHAFMARHLPELQANFARAEAQYGLQHAVFQPFFTALQAQPKLISTALLQKLGFGSLLSYFMRNFSDADGQIVHSQSLILCDTATNSAPDSAHISTALLPQKLQNDVVLLSAQKLENTLRKLFSHEILYLPYTFLICLILLFICFKNIPQTLLAAISPLCAFVCILAGMHILDQPLTLAGLAAMPLVFGLAVDHGIMVTHDMEQGVPLGIQRAVIVSSLTACIGMGMLAFATHPALRAMGQVIFWGLAIELPASLWILPLFCPKQQE